MNYYLYHLQLTEKYQDPATWTEEDSQIIADHAGFLDELGKQGILLLAGRTDFAPDHPNLFGIALIKADSQEAADEIMAGDPAVQKGIQAAKVLPFRMAMSYFKNFVE